MTSPDRTYGTPLEREEPRGGRPRALAAVRLFGILFLLLSPALQAGLFDETTPLPIEIRGPLDDLVDTRLSEDAHRFTLTVEGKSYPIELRSRGKSRLEICRFPPLRMIFPESPTEGPFAGQEKLKLVTHCRDVRNMEMNVLEEYATYRIFQLMSPISYSARLLEVTYVDTTGRLDGVHPAFAIEPTKAMAKRLGGTNLDLPGVSRSSLATDHLSRVYIFQYLVGNTDWSLVTAWGDTHCCHNSKVLDIDGSQHLVPYDFDRTGLVNASYAEPAREARIKKVTQRRYRGYCMEDEAPLVEALRATVALRGDMEAVLRELPGLDDKDLKKDLKFLGKFFEAAEDEAGLLKRFRRQCLD